MSLEKLFSPDKIAVIGASREEGKTGHEVFENLLHGFEGEVVPVNPKADEVEGVDAEDEVPEGTDMAVVVVPADIVPGVMKDCGEKGVESTVIISAGFSESGKEGLEETVMEIADSYGIRVLGPNVLGVMNTSNSMNASFASELPSPGNIAFMSQSGAFCTAILDYAKAENIGFRHFVSLGNKADVSETDLLDYWKETDVEVILSYTEGIEDGRDFMEKASEVSEDVPVVMVKSGRSEDGGEAASSHTGSIAGSYEAYRAAFRKAGVVEAESNRELLDFGRGFSKQPLPEGGNVAVVTNAGGPGVVTTDEISERGLELADFEEGTVGRLEDALPEEASVENPVDVIGDADSERYRKALEAVLNDGNVDSVIVLLTPQVNTEIRKTARVVSRASSETGKPVFACFIGEKEVSPGKDILEENGVPDFSDPKDAVKVVKAMLEHREYVERSETFREIDSGSEEVEEIGELEVFEDERDLLESYGFSFPLTELCETPMEAMESSSGIGYPVVMKVRSPDVHHKTDLDGVRTGVDSREEVKESFHSIADNVHREKPGSEIEGVIVQEELEGVEVALGLKKDPQFGPIVMVGLGGIYIEALNDVSFGVAPVSEEEAEEMIEELRSHEMFEGVRGEESILEPVKDAIIRLGELGLDNPDIEAVDINPLIVRDGEGFVADLEIEMS